MFLTPDDVQRLTGKKRFSAQRRVLDGLGVPYTTAVTGEPLVAETAITEGKGKKRTPRWDLVNA